MNQCDLQRPHPPHTHNTVVQRVRCCAQQYSGLAEHKEAHSGLSGTAVKSCLFMELLSHVKSCHLTVLTTGLKAGQTMFISSQSTGSCNTGFWHFPRIFPESASSW